MSVSQKVIAIAKGLAKEIIIVCVSVGIVILCLKSAQYIQSRPGPVQTTAQGRAQFSVGSYIELRGVDLNRAVSFVLLTSPTCPYCAQSRLFHRRILAEARRRQIPLYLAVPDLRHASAYLSSLGVSTSAAKEWKDLNLRVVGTPTIIAVDSASIAERIWLGVADEGAQVEIEDILADPSLLTVATIAGEGSLSNVRNYSSRDLANLRLEEMVQVIDPRERDVHVPQKDILNIPLLELPIRAAFELDKTQLQLIDCSNLGQAPCALAVNKLSRMGFRVATLAAGSYYQNCQVAPTTVSR